jgi:hypothetical protein
MSLEKIVALCLVAGSLLLVGPAFAQSLDIKKPAPLQSGINSGTADAMVGAHYWYFYADPGSFIGNVVRTNAPGYSVPSPLGLGVAFAPKLQGSVVSSVDKGDTTNFSGSAKQRSRVLIVLNPGPAGLTRAARNYQLQVSGNVSFDGVSSKPPICGTYMGNGDYGMTKFLEDGSIVCSTGLKGKWTLFDADTKTYVVDIEKNRLNLKVIPGRGLSGADDVNVLTFTLLH